MRLITVLIFLCTATAASTNPFADFNAQASQKLFEQYKCNRYHAAMPAQTSRLKTNNTLARISTAITT